MDANVPPGNQGEKPNTPESTIPIPAPGAHQPDASAQQTSSAPPPLPSSGGVESSSPTSNIPPVPPRPHVPPPPQSPPPPLFMAPQPAPQPRRSTGWRVFALILLFLLVLSWLGMMGHFAGHGLMSGSGVERKRQMLQEVLIENRESRNKIAVVKIEGVISSGEANGPRNMVEHVRDQFDAAARDDAVKAVILKVNSPGGEVLASDEIYHAIDDFQANSGKPVIASMQTLAASGGYYVSAPCRWIVANDLTITGSIGVIMHGWNVAGLMNKIGVRSETYKSGKYKDMLSPFRQPEDVTSEERDLVQDLIFETYGKFTNIVSTGRGEAFAANRKLKEQGRELAEDWSQYVDGRVFSGTKAYELGFVDELGDFETAIERAQTLAGISNANLIEYQQQFDFSDLFQLLGQSEARTVKIDVGIDVPKLQAGCLYFLYRHAVP